MKRIWVVFLVASIAVSVAWFFRWDRKEMPVYKGSQIIYLTDRWTGQQWVKYYGKHNGKEYAGEEYPKFNSGVFFATETSIAKQMGLKKLEDKRKDWLLKREEFYSLPIDKQRTVAGSNFFSDYETTIIGIITPPKPPAYITNGIESTNAEIEALFTKAAGVASQKLTKEAYEKRYDASYIGCGSLVLLSVATLLSYLLFNRQPKDSDLVKEV